MWRIYNMTILCYLLFGISLFVLFWAMIGYDVSLGLLKHVVKTNRVDHMDKQYKPFVSLLIVAHNEEGVIQKKLLNAIDNDYPKEKIEYIVASDWSTDATNTIVDEFIEQNKEVSIRLVKSEKHGGKTNAQNEAQKYTTGEILIMTDANAMFEKNSISELVSFFSDREVSYVTGKLSYVNTDNDTAGTESKYWSNELKQRFIESKIKSITAGNGAIYACRNSEYHDFEPVCCHDIEMPIYYVKKGQRALYNPNAVAYEKAGESNEDEFKRKVRMNRDILDCLKKGFEVGNIFKYGWYSYFYFGHRTCRYLLWFAHIMLLFTSAVLMFDHMAGLYFGICFLGQVAFWSIAYCHYKFKGRGRVFRLMTYYAMTVFAQLAGVINIITGKAKPIWDKAESTR